MDMLHIHADFGKGGAGLTESSNGPTLRDLLINHRGAIVETVARVAETAERVEQILLDGVGVQATAEAFTAGAGQTLFPLCFEPLGAVEVRINGQTQLPDEDFDITGLVTNRSLFWHSPDFNIQEGDKIQVFYLRAA